jgi:hypothetical protein
MSKEGKQLKELSGFNKVNVGLSRTYMQSKFEKLADEVLTETGMVLTLNGHLSFAFNDVNMKFNLFKPNSDGKSKSEMEWINNCYRFDLKPTDFGKSFIFQGEKFKITGCKINNVKRPIIAESKKGSYVFTADSIKIK